MNSAYPAQSCDIDAEVIAGFADLAKGGFENPERVEGTVRVSVPEHPGKGFVARFGDELEVLPERATSNPNTKIVIPIATLRRIFREHEFLDWRDISIVGTIVLKGDLDLANLFSRSCIRPDNQTIERFAAVEALHEAKGYRKLDEVERVHRPSQMQVLEAIEDGVPLVITGLEPTPPCRDWTLTRLAEKFADCVVRVRLATQPQTMREFVDELEAFAENSYRGMVDKLGRPYTNGAMLPTEMRADFGPLFFDIEDFNSPQLWLGAVPTHIPTSSLHRDPLAGFLLQVMGRKRLDLYSADQADLIYPMKAYNNYQPCWFRPDNPDFGIYPRAQEARCISVALEPGELLLQPAGWFHQVYALDSPNMSVSYFWRY